MTRWIVFAGLTALLVTGYFATMYAHGGPRWRSVQSIPAELQRLAQEAVAREGAAWAQVKVDGQVATLRGVAPTEADREDVKQGVRGAAGAGGAWWGGITQVRDITTLADAIKPYTWRAVLGVDRRIRLSGHVPGRRYHQAIRAEARKLFPTGVEDQMKIARGHPTGAWDEAAIWALRQLSQLQVGEANFVDAVMTLRGQARDGKVQAALYTAAKSVPRPYEGVAEITLSSAVALPAPEEAVPLAAPPMLAPVQRLAAEDCQKLVDQAMASNTIEFAKGSATIKKTSHALLDRTAQTASACGGLRFRITGHTDGSIEEEDVADLSQTRAERVAMYLAARGVARDRLLTVGAGSSQPISDGSTSAAQARNRRIEISVLP